MKREIKFRGKRIDNGEWVYGSYTQMREDDHNECFRVKPHKVYHRIWQWEAGDWNMGGYANYEVVPETVGQFTGLTDKSGVDIYEGDIILFTWFSYGEYELEHEYKGTVEFINGSYMFCCEHGNYPFSELNFDSESDIEIIGNIFDNPELI